MHKKILVVSSVPVEATSGGSIIIRRHLRKLEGFKIELADCTQSRRKGSVAFGGILDRIRKTRFHRWVEDYFALKNGSWLDRHLKKYQGTHYDLVVTVAHGDAFGSAMRFAKKNQIHLVTFFHDWWPDMALVHSQIVKKLESQFLELHKQSTLSLCACDGMGVNLGGGAQCKTLYPIPAQPPMRIKPLESVNSRKFEILYSGNLAYYGPMVGEALKEVNNDPILTMQARGADPYWDKDQKNDFRAKGWWLDFAPRSELDVWLQTADAFLIVMLFESKMRKRMETSFPSKLIEFAQFGKPLVIWGPNYCSAIQWAEGGRKALCVTNPSPRELKNALNNLARNLMEQERLSEESKRAALEEFNPEKIQNQFIKLIEESISGTEKLEK